MAIACARRGTLLQRLSMYSAAPLTNRVLPVDEWFFADERVVTPLAVLLVACGAQAITLMDFLLRSNSSVASFSHLASTDDQSESCPGDFCCVSAV